jgi:hypothetical protein
METGKHKATSESEGAPTVHGHGKHKASPDRHLLYMAALQRQDTEFSKQIFPEKEYRGLGPNFHIHVSVSDLYISTIGLPILLEEICRPILGLRI